MDMQKVRMVGLATGAVIPLGSARPALLLHQLHGPHNVSASVL